MTTTPEKNAVGSDAVAEDLVSLTIDGVPAAVPKGTLVIRAAEKVGIQIPRFCDHPLLEPAGACRQCLVDIATPGPDGSMRAMPKPQASCTIEVSEGMQVNTQRTSAVAEKAQRGVMELLLINHPLDCPVCDKGGECPLQNQAMSNGRATSRFHDVKRTFPKPIKISTQILLDRERCVLCQRCTRFSKQISGDVFIDLQKRGARSQIGRFDEQVLEYQPKPSGDEPLGEAALDESGSPFASYFSGNVIQICPVGALTSADYRFRARPFDLVSTPAIAEHDANGSALRIDHRRGQVIRRLAGDDPAVNEEWLTDKDRFAFRWQRAADRITTPLIREVGADGRREELREASWPEALAVAAEGLQKAMQRSGVGVLPGGRLTIEDAYAYSKFARVVLETNDIDHRSRPSASEELSFLGAHVAGSGMPVTFADLGSAPAVLLVDFEPEEEGGIVFLRLRSNVRKNSGKVFSIAPFASKGLVKLNGDLLTAAPGTEAEIIEAITTTAYDHAFGTVAKALSADGAVIIVGERAAEAPGTLSAVLRLSERTGARIAWIPRRIGERAGVEFGTVPSLLPGGRPVADQAARGEAATAWGVESIPNVVGRSATDILVTARHGELAGLLIGGVELDDLVDPVVARQALEAADFVVSLEVRASDVTAHADVVLPVAPPSEKAGTYLNWEGRARPFQQALVSNDLSDYRILDDLAVELGTDLGLRTLADVHEDMARFSSWQGTRIDAPDVPVTEPSSAPGLGKAILSTSKLLLDAGRGQDDEGFLTGTAKRAVARVSAATAQRAELAEDGWVEISTTRGSLALPVAITDMPDYVIWIPTNSPGASVHAVLGVSTGSEVEIKPTVPTTKEVSA